MKIIKRNKQKPLKTIILIFLILSSILTITYTSQISKKTVLIASALTPHVAISITDDSGFTIYPGLGTELDPYIIDAYNITTTEDYGIYIKETTKYFVISNCYIDAYIFGIYLERCKEIVNEGNSWGTAYHWQYLRSGNKFS